MDNNNTPRHVFLSYNREDASFMRRVRAELEREGFIVWMDEGLIPGTESWKTSIETAIRDALSLVVILSPSANRSIWVERELDFARIHDIPVIPILIRGDPRDSIPIELINSQWIDIRNKKDFNIQIQALIAALKIFNQVKPHRGYPPPKKIADKSPLNPTVLMGFIFGMFLVSGLTISIIFWLRQPKPDMHADVAGSLELPASSPTSENKLMPTLTPTRKIIPPTFTPTPTRRVAPPTPTPTPAHVVTPPTPTPIKVRSLSGLTSNCIGTDIWQAYPLSEKANDDCWELSHWGLSSDENGLMMFVDNPVAGERRGIYAPLQGDHKITFDLRIDQIETVGDNIIVNLGFGLIPSRPVNPDTGTLIYYQLESNKPQWNVVLKTKERGGFEDYLYKSGTQDFLVYKVGTTEHITLEITEALVSIAVNGNQVVRKSVSFADRAFWIGYKFERGGALSAKITNLSLQEK
jgi:hypothetical protein